MNKPLNEMFVVYPTGYANSKNIPIPFIRFFETDIEAEVFVSDFYFKHVPIGTDDIGLSWEKVQYLLDEEFYGTNDINVLFMELEIHWKRLAPIPTGTAS